LKSKTLEVKSLDALVALSIFLLSYLVYFIGCKELLEAGFYDKINLAFDLDQNYYFDLIGRNPIDWQFMTATEFSPLNIKHPFIYLYHYIVIALNMMGVSNSVAVIIISQVFHSGSLVVSYFIFRSIGRRVIESGFVTFGLAGTSTYMSSGLVLDVYTISIFWISLIFLMMCWQVYQGRESSIGLRVFISVMAIGTTSSLIFLVLIMEYSLLKIKSKEYTKIAVFMSLYKQFMRILVLGLVLFFLVYFQTVLEIIQDPIGVLKTLFWTVIRPGEKAGVFQVISAFTLFSILSPKTTEIELPEGITMIDLRYMDFSYIGWIAVAIIVLSLLVKCKKNEHRFIFIFSLTWIMINTIMHMSYQYRGSVFLYTGHFVLAVFIVYFVPIKISIIDFCWEEKLYKWLDKLLVYIIPVGIWLNNIYLYQEINKINLFSL